MMPAKRMFIFLFLLLTTGLYAGTLKVGIYPNHPKVFIDTEGKPAGFFVDLTDEIARQNSIDIEYIPGTWPENITKLEAGELDLLVDVSFSPSRAERFRLNDVFVVESWVQAFSLPGNRISTIKDLNGRRVAVLEKSVQETYLREELVKEFKLSCTILVLPGYDEMVKAVKSGEADLMLGTRFFFLSPARPDDIIPSPVIIRPQGIFYAFRKGIDETIVKKFDETLVILQNTQGSAYHAAFEKWFNPGFAQEIPLWLKVLMVLFPIAVVIIAGVIVAWNSRLKSVVSRETARIRKREERLELAMMAANDGLWDWNIADSTVYFDQRYYTMAGYEPDEFPHNFHQWEIRVHPEDIGACNKAIQSHVSGETSVFDIEFRFLRKEGTWMWIRGRGKIVQKDPEGKACRMIGTHTDVTDRKLTEEALVIFKESLENATDAIGMSTPEGRHYYQNRAFSSLFGDIGEYPPETLYVDLETGEEVFRTIMNGGEWAGEVKMFSRERELLDIFLRAYASRNRNGVITALVGVHTDITERKQAEAEREKLHEQLVQSQKMESIGRLAGGVAHDFNNMLSVIISQAELGLLKTPEDSPVYSRFREIEKAARRSADLTRQLLSFARKQAINPRVLELNDVIRNMLTMLKRLIGEDIELVWLPASDIGRIKMDPTQIDQVLANLCVNSRDAISDTGKITISTGSVFLDKSFSSDDTGFEPGEYVQLSVSDTGCGMEPEIFMHLFEPFFTTKGVGKGTGLGLAMVYGIVKQNQGLIDVTSEPGAGTTFNIYFPVYRDSAEHIAAEKPVKQAAAGTETILLVEDEPMLMESTAAMLKEFGYNVVTAAKAEEAMRVISEPSGELHLLLIDVVMPEMNGRDLADRILAVRPGLKVIFMSGYTADVIAHHGVLEEGVNFIQKPFSIEELASKVRGAIDS